jgi:pseudouridine synthase
VEHPVRRSADGAHRRTLERVLSRAGFCSRTVARQLIESARVHVNGRAVRDPDEWIDPERDDVRVDGRPLRAARPTYLALNKPKGVLTSFGDPRGRRTVYDLLGEKSAWLVPIGRLDRDSSGLLLLTNDTDFAERIASPASKIVKTYRVETSTRITDDDLERLRAGVELDDGPARPERVERVRDFAQRSVLSIELTEGRNREVRRMLQAIGSRARELRRTRIGPIELGKLRSGATRPLTRAELAALGLRA